MKNRGTTIEHDRGDESPLNSAQKTVMSSDPVLKKQIQFHSQENVTESPTQTHCRGTCGDSPHTKTDTHNDAQESTFCSRTTKTQQASTDDTF